MVAAPQSQPSRCRDTRQYIRRITLPAVGNPSLRLTCDVLLRSAIAVNRSFKGRSHVQACCNTHGRRRGSDDVSCRSRGGFQPAHAARVRGDRSRRGLRRQVERPLCRWPSRRPVHPQYRLPQRSHRWNPQRSYRPCGRHRHAGLRFRLRLREDDRQLRPPRGLPASLRRLPARRRVLARRSGRQGHVALVQRQCRFHRQPCRATATSSASA